MKVDRLNKLYTALTLTERLNLVMAAISRDDMEEKEKLFKTCPKKYYLALDYSFSRKYDRYILISTLVCSMLENLENKSQLLLLELYLLQQQLKMIESSATVKCKEIKKHLKKYINLLNDCYTQNLVEIKTLQESFLQFFVEVGIRREIASAILSSMHIGDVTVRTARINSVTVDKDRIQYHINVFRKIFE